MLIVYLDQNKWIELANAAHGKDPSGKVGEYLEFIRASRDMKLACFPLSFTHYAETLRRSHVESREKLANLMLEVSGGKTLAWGPRILRYEIENALQRRFPGKISPEDIEPLAIVGTGMEHASNEPVTRFVATEDVERVLGYAGSQRFANVMNDWIERSLLGAPSPVPTDDLPRVEWGDLETSFVNNQIEVRDWLASLHPRQFEDGLYWQAMLDVAPLLGRSLRRFGIETGALLSSGIKGIRNFIDELPMERVALHVLKGWAQNKTLKPRRSDLFDWMGLVPATAYCDVVIAEKLFVDLATRPGTVYRAAMSAKLSALPLALSELSRL